MPRNPGLYDGIPLGFSSKPRMKTRIILLLSLAFMAPAWAGVLPNDAVVDGRTIGEWGAEWWKWGFSLSTNQHPLFDPDGSNAHVGQPDGPVFFLAGQFGVPSPSIATRTFTMPEGKYLFHPVLNVYAGDPLDPLPIELRFDAAAAFINGFTELHASIDGVAVPNLPSHRAASPVFTFEFPSCDNIMTVNNGFCISGFVDNLLTDGFWLMIEPLPPGEHVINFGFTVGTPPFASQLDITDTITVVPVSLEQRVEQLIASVAAANLPRNRQRPLLATLRVATKSFARDHLKTGIRHLRAFQKKVRHEINRIDPTLAEQLIAAAQQIIDRANQNLEKLRSKEAPPL